jgi:RNA recognition motif-containing protein
MNIYVANVPFKASQEDLKELFEEYGEVSSAKIILDKDTQKSRGFAFVEMPDDSEANNAVDALNGYNFLGKELVVNEARPKTAEPRSSGNFKSNSYKSDFGGGFKRR